jgi:hypothetical protein
MHRTSLALFALGIFLLSFVALAGKGEIDGSLIIDTNASVTERRVEIHIWDTVPSDEWDDVTGAASTSQAAFDTEMGGIFTWYSGQPAVGKSRLRASINAR